MLFIFLSTVIAGAAMSFFLHAPNHSVTYYVLSESNTPINHDPEPANFIDVFPEPPTPVTANLVPDCPEYSLNVELATDTLLDTLDLPVHQAFTIRELKAMAKNRGIKGYSKMNKLQLSEAIEAHENRT